VTPPSAPLLPLVAAGDARAAQACVERYGRLVWAIARKTARSDSDAEDVTQDIFEELFRSAERFDPTRSSEPGFVAMIARRRAIDGIRRQASRANTVLETPDVSLGVELRIDADRISAALEALPSQERDVLLMTVVEGLSHREVAERNALPLGTVKTVARRGLLRIRAWFEQTEQEETV